MAAAKKAAASKKAVKAAAGPQKAPKDEAAQPVQKPAKRAVAKRAPAASETAGADAPTKPRVEATPVKKTRGVTAGAEAPRTKTRVDKTRGVTAGAEAPRTKTRVDKTRVVIPMDVYEPQKDAIKAPFKERGLKWTFLGEGRGLYKHPEGGIHCFTQFKDDGVHYSVWGEDKAGVAAILDAWRALLGPAGWAAATARGEAATASEAQAAESDALRAWKLAEPQPRPGEPDFFYKKRRAEWEAKKPAA